MIFVLVPSANAANLKDVQAKVEALQEEAAMAAEGAQAAKVELAKLNKTLKTVQAKAATQQGNVSDLQNRSAQLQSPNTNPADLVRALNYFFLLIQLYS